jgi:hypothetical protein
MFNENLDFCKPVYGNANGNAKTDSSGRVQLKEWILKIMQKRTIMGRALVHN